MLYPSGQDVADFLGRGDDDQLVALACQHVAIVGALAHSYTRGGGFTAGEPYDDVAAVIITATARLLPNPAQTVSESLGDFAVRPGVFHGWTLAESFVLNRYRRRSA
jgi:hypothetical protein